jgi:hypothetical protein
MKVSAIYISGISLGFCCAIFAQQHPPTDSHGFLIPLKMRPLEFLEHLKQAHLLGRVSVSGRKAAAQWLNDEDISKLGKLLNDNTKCAGVALAISSDSGHAGSTIGVEAAYILLGHIRGEYPPKLNSWDDTAETFKVVKTWLQQRRDSPK